MSKLPPLSRALKLLVCLALLVRPAAAYETDQLTHREDPLEDVLPLANRRMDEILTLAVERTNRRTDCQLGREVTRQVLARQIRRLGGGLGLVPDRGLVRMWGYSRFSAWLERQAVGRRAFLVRDDIFSELGFWQSPILRGVGPSGTFKVAGTLIGADKFDHFFELGYDYYLQSAWGTWPEQGLAFGTASERTFFGMMTSRTFSFADLASNADGYYFFAELLTEGSVLRMGEDGCVQQVRPWDWTEWVTWEWDEVLNPSVYVPVVQGEISEFLAAHREDVCRSYEIWGGPAYQEHLDRVLTAWPPYAVGPAPARSDPYQLERLCRGDPLYRDGARRAAASIAPK